MTHLHGTYDNIELLDSFGFGNVSPAVSYILRPISYDLKLEQMQ